MVNIHLRYRMATAEQEQATFGGLATESDCCMPSEGGLAQVDSISDPASAYVHVCESHTAHICTLICTGYSSMHI